MTRIHLLIIVLLACGYAVTQAPAARADDTVTYEVASHDIAGADVEYIDVSGRRRLEQVPLPWRINATVVDPHSDDAEVRADWPLAHGTSRWVTVRVYSRGSLLCENTQDVGSATCWGAAHPIR